MPPIISFYHNVKDTTSTETIQLPQFLQDIKDGKGQDQVLRIRTLDEDSRRVEKTKLPNVTISGVFGKRLDNDCKSHSGFIAIDIDDLGNELEGVRTLLQSDPFIYAGFTSVSGKGFCIIIKIDSEKHKESFEAISSYLLNKYQLIVDPTGINVSRTRFVSFDPELFIKEQSIQWKKYLPKPRKRSIAATVFVQTEFDKVISQMVEQGISCVEDYRDWRDIAFGLADKFGEIGRPYFHKLSACSDKYEPSICDRQYTHAMKSNNRRGGDKITIATIYWFAKQAGIQVQSTLTKKITAATNSLKKSGKSLEQIKQALEQHEGITNADDIIKQAMSSHIPTSNNLVDNIRMWLRHSFKLKRNLITRKIEEHSGSEPHILEEIDINTMFLDCKIIYEEVNYELFMRVLLSANTQTYNPLKEFITHGKWDGHCRIDQLAKCITSNTGDEEYRERMLMKWLVGIIHSIMGNKNELNFIFVGEKNTGKTTFFRELLPLQLRSYFAESQLSRGRDDEMLMCENVIIFNDEYGGKNKTDERNEKRLMASDNFSLREPYGRTNVTLKRLASLCGTCNEEDVLDDPTGNRRIIVIKATGKFDYELYNSIDKAQLFFEAYELWKDGERPVLNDTDIACLEHVDKEYLKASFEEELLQLHFYDPAKSSDFFTTTEIKLRLESETKDKIHLGKLGSRIRKLGYIREKRGDRYGYIITPIPKVSAGQLPINHTGF
jgi:predicted P-loop ATPase